MAVNCQIPTPEKYVEIMLDAIKYNGNVFGKRVLENSFGSGNILVKIVERYITNAISQNIGKDEIHSGLCRDIYGYETDKMLFDICKNKLDELANNYGIQNVKWNLENDDALNDETLGFDFIMSNPPYITYHDLTLNQREMLKKKYNSCKGGRFDYYYAFLEDGIKALNKNGKMIFLIPNNVLKNVYGKNIRNILKDYVTEILDFSNCNVFDGITVSPIMLLCEKKPCSTIVVKDMEIGCENYVEKEGLLDKWVLWYNEKQKEKRRFGDFFKVSNSIATLKNEVFILNADLKTEKLKLEKELLVTAVSPRTLRDKTRKIAIFPYKTNGNNIVRLEENEFENMYPNVYKYLSINKEKLKLRAINNTTKWYEYGRNQALESVYGRKLVIPMVFSGKVNVYEAGDGEIPFAGYYITKISDKSLDYAKKILCSKEFKKYFLNLGTKTNKTTYRISCKDIENYTF